MFTLKENQEFGSDQRNRIGCQENGTPGQSHRYELD